MEGISLLTGLSGCGGGKGTGQAFGHRNPFSDHRGFFCLKACLLFRIEKRSLCKCYAPLSLNCHGYSNMPSEEYRHFLIFRAT